MATRIPLTWTVGPSSAIGEQPVERVPAVVPGAVQLDWARAQGWPAPEYAEDVACYSWMEDRYWVYHGSAEFAGLGAGQRLFFVCGGVDYRFQVRCGGAVLHEQEGMFTPVELDVTDMVKPGDQIELVVFPAPKSHATPVDNRQPDQSCKPAVSYGWDFHPRLVPLGIWQEAYLEVRSALHIARAEVFYDLRDDFSQAVVKADVSLSMPAEATVRLTVDDQCGHRAFSVTTPATAAGTTLQGAIDNPQLWWPNGQGEAFLYTAVVELVDGNGAVADRRVSRIGFRKVRLVMHPTQWDDPEVNKIPKGPNKVPITLEVNGRRIFGKGSNWVSPDIFPARVTDELLRQQLDLARDANVNLLRCWGGAIVQRDAFFDLCDERGIMVWQEFPLACNRYEGTPGYLAVLDRESRSIITRLRRHACLVLWCGGNELFNPWSRMTEQDLALRLLNRNCYDLDPQKRPFLMTSPSFGMGHGNYLFKFNGMTEVFQCFRDATCTAYTEFGVPGPAPAATLRRIIPESEIFPPREEGAWLRRHGFRAWDGSAQSWLELDCIESYFGRASSLEQLVDQGQLLQSEGLKCIFEEARRQKPACSMALNWCYNEPWPTAANNSLLSWPSHPKPGYGAMKQALRPVLASARIRKFSWKAGELFDPELWLLSDLPVALMRGHVTAHLEAGAQRFLLLSWDFTGTPANTNLPGPVIRYTLPAFGVDRVRLVLSVKDHPEWDSSYVLVYRP